MTNEIKERIAQINNGTVPKGYKETPFGIFPNDWETDKTLKDLGKFGKGKGIPGEKLFDSGVPCIGYGDIYMKYNYFFNNAKSFTDKETAQASKKVSKGTLLFTGTGETSEEIGKCVCYNGEEDIYAGGDIITFVPNNVNSMFLAYQQYQNFSLRKKYSFGQGHSVVHIHKEELEKLPVATPSDTDEQERIAQILSKWDKAIELQEQLIERLEIQKIAIFQKSLVPNDTWESISLGNICKIKTGKLDANAANEDGLYPFFTCAKEISYINEYAFDAEALLIAGNGDIGDIKYYNGKFNAYQRTYVLSNFELPIKYVYYFLQKNFDREVLLGTQKSSMPYIKLETLKKAKIKYNENMEQIVDLLENVDSILEKETKKLSCLKKQQKSMQQLLLTGIVRV